ncbi:MAG: hypothetical protein HY402_00850, partial [Elusimicrobia bacterium]|nr:hypothetical protein [Elusimicrobiota bacterium]
MKRQSLAYFGVAVLAGWLALPLAGEELDNAGFKDARNAANAGGAESADQAGFEALHYLAEVSLSTHSNTSFNSRAGLGALHVFPETITNLRALSSFAGVRDGEIQLTWTAPLSSKSTGTVDAYILKRSLSEINSQTDFQNATEITQGIAPQAPGNTETFLAGSLTPRTTYHIRLESLDQAAAASFMSNASSAPAAAVPPGAVTNLSALTGSSPATIDLTWTAPGDDEYQGSIVGGLYRIDYSTEIDHTFDVRTTWQVELSTGVAPGENQAYTLTNLLEGNTYYIRIWTRDELSDNWS